MKPKSQLYRKAKSTIQGVGIFALMLLFLASSFGFSTETLFTIDTHGKLHGFYTYYVPETGEQGSISNGKIIFTGVQEVIIGGQPEYGANLPSHPMTPVKKIKIELKKMEYLKPEKFSLAVIIPAGRSRRIILNNPPVSSPWHFPSGISYLTSLLRQGGHEVSQRYGHIIGLEHVLSLNDESKTTEALGIVRNPSSTINDWYRARKIFEEISKAVPTQDKFAVERNNVVYVASYQDGTIEGALKAVQNRESNIWYPYFSAVEIPHLLSVKPDLYGISIGDERQLFPGLILASMVKEALPETKVVLGGNFWSRVLTAYEQPQFFELFNRCCDAIVYREGFLPLLELAQHLSPNLVSGTVWSDGKKLVMNKPAQTPMPFELLPAPSYDGGARQWSPDPVYPLYTASNCFMQCEFCSISGGSDTFLGKPRTSSAKHIVSQMIASNGHRFDFYDEMLPIQTQLKIGEELKVHKYKAEWYCYSTADHHLLDPDVCHQLYDAGCRGLQIGLESLDTQTLGNENKRWNKPDHYGKILANLKQAGIHTHIFIIVGLPGEPLHQTLKWLSFIEKYGDSILTIKSSRYRIAKNAPDEKNGNFKYIELLPDDHLLHLNRNFRYLSASNKKVDALRDLLEQSCREHWAYGVTSSLPWWTNRGRYTWDELKAMSREIPKNEPIPHLDRAITKANTIIQDELGINTHFKSFEDLMQYTRTI
jgi:radical SAM superfamily enzyme YgiQ (UPF0313 family)